MYINPQSENLISICLKYGQLCDQDDESEEGLYLLQFLTATLDPEIIVTPEDVKEFNKRLQKYVEKFPESKVFRSISVKEKKPEEILTQIENITGFTEEKRQWFKRNLNLLSRGQLPVPYLIRHEVLMNVSNFIHLWEFSKISEKDHLQYLLTISAERYELRKIENFRDRIPLIDEIALVVLFDLELLEYVLKIFPKVAIAKISIANLQMLAQGIIFAPYVTKAKDIVELLSKHVDQILQPSNREAIDEDHIFSALDQIKSVYDPSKFFFYTDDAISRVYICGDAHYENTISTIDIITILKDSDFITKEKAAEKFAKLCSFNVIGAPINYKDILIVLKDDLNMGESIEGYLEKLNKHKNFNSFINGMWWVKKDYKKTLIEIGQFLSYMIAEEEGIKVDPNIITAIWYVWFQKVQFIIEAEESKLHFFSRSFLSTSIALIKRMENVSENKKYWERAWNIYNDIINFAYGNSMSREIENNSKTLLAQMIAKFELESKRAIFHYIASGLTNGTSDRDILTRQHSQTLTELKIQKK